MRTCTSAIQASGPPHGQQVKRPTGMAWHGMVLIMVSKAVFWGPTSHCFWKPFRSLMSKMNSWVPPLTSGCIPIQGAGVHVAECGGCSVPCTVV